MTFEQAMLDMATANFIRANELASQGIARPGLVTETKELLDRLKKEYMERRL